MNLESLKYPIGNFQSPTTINKDMIQAWIVDIEKFPTRVKQEIEPLTPEQLDWVYRPNGWTIRQVVHHCADSHMNAFIRMKLASTEDRPTIKPYLEAEWAKQADYKISVASSIKMLEGLHHRWVTLLKQMDGEVLERTFLHPEHGKESSIGFNVAMYAWHCNHHLGHVKQAILSGGRS